MVLPTLRDGDLVLRPKRLEDLDAITAACQDPEIPRWTLVPSPYTRADAEAFLARSAEEEAAGQSANLLAVDARDGTLLGSFSVMGLDREPGFRDNGELTRLPRGDHDEPVYAVYVRGAF
jgi:RimJ/RimL family protein N-acetyltransferase